MNEKQINDLVDKKLADYSRSSLREPRHTHNRVDSQPLDPQYFLGFPVKQVADATTAPKDTPANGTFRFYVDGTHQRLWAYLTSSVGGTLASGWHYTVLT